jgi:RimJ/RimL family protein N-acetyltransferase
VLDGNSVTLRPWLEEDLPVFTDLRNDVRLQAQLLSRVRGSRPVQVREWLESFTGQADRILLVITEKAHKTALGYIQVTDLNSLDARADLGICLVNRAQGRGLGGEAISMLADHLRDQWHLRKLSLRVRADNAAALRCYEKLGFERCGLLRQHVFISGIWHDIVLMELFLAEKE